MDSKKLIAVLLGVAALSTIAKSKPSIPSIPDNSDGDNGGDGSVPIPPNNNGNSYADFEISILRVKDAEGGYQNNYFDNGNWTGCQVGSGTQAGTNFGISACKIGSFATENYMRNLTWYQAKQIYKSDFWDDIRASEINNQFVADIFFDGRVNHGRTGTRLMQEVLNVTRDGIVGPITLGAINNSDPAALYRAYKARRINFYYELAQRPNQNQFLQGWLNRINEFNDY